METDISNAQYCTIFKIYFNKWAVASSEFTSWVHQSLRKRGSSQLKGAWCASSCGCCERRVLRSAAVFSSTIILFSSDKKLPAKYRPADRATFEPSCRLTLNCDQAQRHYAACEQTSSTAAGLLQQCRLANCQRTHRGQVVVVPSAWRWPHV